MSSIPGRVYEGRLSSLNSFLINSHVIVEDKCEDYDKRLKELESKISLLNSAPVGEGGHSGPDLDTLNKLLSDFIKKSEMEDLLKRLQKCEKKAKKAKDLSKKNEKKHKKWKPQWI
jgi:tetrahydromethanopterin S-methyltransferase subunit G